MIEDHMEKLTSGHNNYIEITFTKKFKEAIENSIDEGLNIMLFECGGEYVKLAKKIKDNGYIIDFREPKMSTEFLPNESKAIIKYDHSECNLTIYKKVAES